METDTAMSNLFVGDRNTISLVVPNEGTGIGQVEGGFDSVSFPTLYEGLSDMSRLEGTIIGSSDEFRVLQPYDGTIKCKLLTPMAKLPTKGSVNAAGFDLYSAQVATLNHGQRLCISTGIAISIPPGYYGRIAPRSGLAVKNGANVLAGVVDSDFRGEVKVILINHGDTPMDIRQHDRIAQLIIERCGFWGFEQVEELEDTTRGTGGFGSTGV